jgi:hypothetical protein
MSEYAVKSDPTPQITMSTPYLDFDTIARIGHIQ